MTTALTPAAAEELTHALTEVCAGAGLDPGGAHLVKFTINAVYTVGEHVVRIGRGPLAADRADRVVAVAAAFTQRDMPTVRLAADIAQPIHAGDWVATIWHRVPTGAAPPAPADLAPPLSAIHALDALPPVQLPDWAPVDKHRRRLAAVRALPPAEADLTHSWARSQVGCHLDEVLGRLESACDRLDEQLAAVDWRLPVGVIHGDAHPGNLLTPPSGAILCDLDSVAIGPREWDLVPTAHGPERFGRPTAGQRAFAAAYGFDITTWPGWPILRDVRELQLVTSVLDNLAGRPGVADQLAHRLRSILANDHTTTWTNYR